MDLRRCRRSGSTGGAGFVRGRWLVLGVVLGLVLGLALEAWGAGTPLSHAQASTSGGTASGSSGGGGSTGTGSGVTGSTPGSGVAGVTGGVPGSGVAGGTGSAPGSGGTGVTGGGTPGSGVAGVTGGGTPGSGVAGVTGSAPGSGGTGVTGGTGSAGNGSGDNASRPRLEVTAGYWRQPAGGPWVPAQITITHPGPGTFRGTVEVAGVVFVVPGPTASPQLTPPGQSRSFLDVARWRQPVEVPAGASRTLIVPLAIGARETPTMSVEVRLRDERGDVVAWAPASVGRGRPADLLVALIAARDIPYLNTLPVPRGGSASVERLQPELAPRTTVGWANFDLVVVDGAAALRRLDGVQRESLAAWVQLGGTLLLGTGPDAAALAEALGPGLFPWEVVGSTQLRQFDEAITWARPVDPDVTAPNSASAAVAALLRPAGTTGDIGAAGMTGPTGPAGTAGETGAAGAGGATGQGGQGGPGGDAGGTAQAGGSDQSGRNTQEGDNAQSSGTIQPGGSVQPGGTSEAAGDTDAGGNKAPAPIGYIARVGFGRVYAWSTRLDVEPWLSWPGTPATLAGWLGGDAAPPSTRLAAAVTAQAGMGFRPPTSSGVQDSVDVATPLDAGGHRSLVQSLLRSVFSPNGQWSSLEIWRSGAQDLPGLQFPSTAALIGGVILYIVLIGPVTFGWLGRRRRRPWAWVVVPALAVLVIGGSYASGSVAGRGTPHTAAGFLLLDESGTRGVWSGMVAAYRPGRAAALTLRHGSLVAPMTGFISGGPFDRPLEDPAMVAELSPRGVEVSWPASGAGRVIPVAAHLDLALTPGGGAAAGGAAGAREGAGADGGDGRRGLTARWLPAGDDRWRIEVVNGLDVTLSDVMVLQGAQVLARFGDLAPGEQAVKEARVRHDPTSMLALTGPGGAFGPLVSGSTGLPAADSWALRQRARLEELVRNMIAAVSGSPLLMAGVQGTPVVAEAGAARTPPAPTAPATTAGPEAIPPSRWDPSGYTLLLAPVVEPGLGAETPAAGPPAPTPVAGTATPPAASLPAFTASNAVWPAETREILAGEVVVPAPDRMILRNGVAVMEWRPPAAVAAKAHLLEIRLDRSRFPSSAAPAPKAGIDLYDFAAGQWVTVKEFQGGLPTNSPRWVTAGVTVSGNQLQVEGEALRRFLPPRGRLLVRFHGPAGYDMVLSMPAFLLEVSP